MTYVRSATLRVLAPGALAAAACVAALAPGGAASARSSHAASHRVPGATGGPRNRLTSADGTLDTPVGVYSDCSGASPLPAGIAAVDTCIHGRTYFVGHNQGVFTPLMHMGVGSLLTWYDARGTVHRYRVVAVRDAAGGARPLTTTGHVAAQFQTCAVSDGSIDRVLDAVAV